MTRIPSAATFRSGLFRSFYRLDGHRFTIGGRGTRSTQRLHESGIVQDWFLAAAGG